VTFAPPSRLRPRPGAIALILAWLLLLGVLAAAAGYVFMVPEQMAPELVAAAPDTEATGAAKPPEPDLPETGQMAETTSEPGAIPEPEAAPEPPAAPEPEAAPEPPAAPAPLTEAAPEPAPTPEPETRPEPEPETAEAPEAPPPPPPATATAPASETAAAPEPPKTAETPKAREAPEPKGPQVAALEPDPQSPWRRNRQPFNEADPRPRIAVVLTGLGLASKVTEAAIKELPGGITLSFTPYSSICPWSRPATRTTIPGPRRC
jgi:hypothetical protein